jgi:hypothetical protein
MRSVLIIFILIIFNCNLSAQDEKTYVKPTENNGNALLITVHYTAMFPFKDVAKRFGFTSGIGGAFTYQLKHRIHVGAEGSFLFGKTVKEQGILDHITTADGYFINADDNSLTTVFLQERGMILKAVVGKTIPFSRKNPDNHSGILFLTGIGYMQHKILIDPRAAAIPQLNKTYRKGYDRLTSGVCISQFVGAILLKRKKFVSLYGGFQVDAGFTKSQRNWNFDTNSADKAKRIDLFLSVKVAWIIPVFKKFQE